MLKQNNKTKRGFTLSEVLIAMVIMGVIAAATIPTIINSTNQHQYVNGLKRANLMLKTATSELMLENSGTMAYLISSNDNGALLDKYCTKLNCIKKCYNADYSCFSRVKTLDNPAGSTGRTFSAILSNGMLINFIASEFPSCAVSPCGRFSIDINGFKQPNILGRDIFNFGFKINSFYPFGTKNDNLFGSVWTLYCNPSAINSGANCAGRVLIEGAMNY